MRFWIPAKNVKYNIKASIHPYYFKGTKQPQMRAYNTAKSRDGNPSDLKPP